MLEKVNQFAEQAATDVSRRRFLERFRRGAMALAAGAAGFLASSRDASAGRRGGGGGGALRCRWHGRYFCPDGTIFDYYSKGKCREDLYGCTLSFCIKTC